MTLFHPAEQLVTVSTIQIHKLERIQTQHKGKEKTNFENKLPIKSSQKNHKLERLKAQRKNKFWEQINKLEKKTN